MTDSLMPRSELKTFWHPSSWSVVTFCCLMIALYMSVLSLSVLHLFLWWTKKSQTSQRNVFHEEMPNFPCRDVWRSQSGAPSGDICRHIVRANTLVIIFFKEKKRKKSGEGGGGENVLCVHFHRCLEEWVLFLCEWLGLGWIFTRFLYFSVNLDFLKTKTRFFIIRNKAILFGNEYM